MIGVVAELLCLLYHEARNVRHPLKAGKLANGGKYEKLVNLPTNRIAAWHAMETFRERAATATTGRDSAAVFEHVFSISLSELEELYRSPCWKNSAYGGNRWAPICARVRELVDALDQGEKAKTDHLIKAITEMEHNTGVVGAKLKGFQSE